MITKQNPKRRHHHVWQKYLKPWTTDDAIWCLQSNRIFQTGTKSIAVEKDFYKLSDLTDDEISYIKLMFDKCHPLAKRNHAQLLNMLITPFQVIKRMGPTSEKAAIDKLLNEYASNTLEDYHANIEASLAPSLNDALSGDISFYDDDKRCIPFLHSLCMQYMRTKGIKEKLTEMQQADGSSDLSRVWNILVPMFAYNLGSSLFLERKRRKLVLIHNRTDIQFITGDQPAINLKSNRPNPPESLTIYYPISPEIALLLGEIDEEPLFATEGITSAQVTSLNQNIFEASHTQVFAGSKESLRAIHSGQGLRSIE